MPNYSTKFDIINKATRKIFYLDICQWYYVVVVIKVVVGSGSGSSSGSGSGSGSGGGSGSGSHLWNQDIKDSVGGMLVSI